jgi:MYXO-CTERM domain-containing protein
MRRSLVLLTAMAAAFIACTEGRGGGGDGANRGDPAGVRRHGGLAALCTSAPVLRAPSAAADAILVDDAVFADAILIDDASSGSGSDADAGSGSDAGMGSGSDAGTGSGSDAGTGSGSDAGTGSGSDAGTGSDGGIDCRGLDIVEAMIPLVPMGSGTAEVRSVPGFTDVMTSATISGDGFVFMTPGCQPQQCDFASMPKALPFVLTIACNATDGQAHTGTLLARGPQGPSDFDTASLSCAAGSTGPLLNVAPTSINAGDLAVGMSSGHGFGVTNNGTAPLTFSISLPAAAPAWTAPGSPCIAPAQCSIPPGGGMMINLAFAPTEHGTSAGTVLVTSPNATNTSSVSVGVTGNGLGSRIAIDLPSGAIDFGTIPRGSTATRSLSASAVGNLVAPVTLAASAPGAPFAVSPAQLALLPGVPQDLTFSCSSPTATGPVARNVTLSSPDAYALDTGTVSLMCEVANTQVSVAPGQFDFGEVRKGTQAPTLPFTISNPGPLDATISAVELAGAPAPLSLSLGGGSLPRTLPAGATMSGQLALGTDADLDLAQPAPKLKISVDGEQLVFPVTGKVTTPAAYVTPEKLELGTACIGSGVSAVVSMINSGTARLLMEPPRAEGSFKLQLQSPPSYPAPLLAGTTATVAVTPVVEAPGELAGQLTWSVDAPRAPFVVPVSLAFIDTGTAISPASLTFSTVQVDQISLRYTVTLQNCSTAPAMVTVDGVDASRGGTAAWKVEPSQDARTLAPQDKLTISVAFAPLRQGHHVARLRLGVDGESRFVTLEGDGIDLDFKRTSFYACGCTAPNARTGWPIALAVLLVTLRWRRRRRMFDRAPRGD